MNGPKSTPKQAGISITNNNNNNNTSSSSTIASSTMDSTIDPSSTNTTNTTTGTDPETTTTTTSTRTTRSRGRKNKRSSSDLRSSTTSESTTSSSLSPTIRRPMKQRRRAGSFSVTGGEAGAGSMEEEKEETMDESVEQPSTTITDTTIPTESTTTVVAAPPTTTATMVSSPNTAPAPSQPNTTSNTTNTTNTATPFASPPPHSGRLQSLVRTPAPPPPKPSSSSSLSLPPQPPRSTTIGRRSTSGGSEILNRAVRRRSLSEERVRERGDYPNGTTTTTTPTTNSTRMVMGERQFSRRDVRLKPRGSSTALQPTTTTSVKREITDSPSSMDERTMMMMMGRNVDNNTVSEKTENTNRSESTTTLEQQAVRGDAEEEKEEDGSIEDHPDDDPKVDGSSEEEELLEEDDIDRDRDGIIDPPLSIADKLLRSTRMWTVVLFFLHFYFQSTTPPPPSSSLPNTHTCTIDDPTHASTFCPSSSPSPPPPLNPFVSLSSDTPLPFSFLSNYLANLHYYSLHTHSKVFGTPPPVHRTVRVPKGKPQTIVTTPPPKIVTHHTTETVWVDNIELEHTERDLVRKRRLIQAYQTDLERRDTALEEIQCLESEIRRWLHSTDEEEDGTEPPPQQLVGEDDGLYGTAARKEHEGNHLRQGLMKERTVLMEWEKGLMDARNGLETLVYEEELEEEEGVMSVVGNLEEEEEEEENQRNRRRMRAKERLNRLVDVTGGLVRDVDVQVLKGEELRRLVDSCYEELTKQWTSGENRKLLQRIVSVTDGKGGSNDGDGDGGTEAVNDETYPQENLIERVDLLNAQRELEEKAKMVLKEIVADAEVDTTVGTWINTTVRTYLTQHFPPIVPDPVLYTPPNSTSTDPRIVSLPSRVLLPELGSIIDNSLEFYKADGTNRLDYASVRSGATVIRVGPRRTTLSVAENLPLVNRGLARAKLRFYGHGAEAALLPTFPPTANGQCWSVEQEGTRPDLWTTASVVTDLMERSLRMLGGDWEEEESGGSYELEADPYRGAYATLAVRLAERVRVEEIMIEHPVGGVGAGRKSAVNGFRVIGYEDEKAEGDGWFLGQFVYGVEDTDPAVQKFKVETTQDNGRIPPLSSIVLAIDGNWGGHFTCLYRFRVHGRK